jgi:peptidyl-dipeptidase A
MARCYRSFFNNLLTVILVFCFVAMSVILSCSNKKERVGTKDELVKYLDTLEQKYEYACVQTGIANWNMYSREGKSELDTAKNLFSKIFIDTLNKKIIEEWRGKSASLADKMLERRLEMWYRCFLGGSVYADEQIAELENKLQRKITNYKLYYDGNRITQAEIRNEIRKEPDQKKRKKLWLTVGQLSEAVKEDLVALVKLRNEKAKSLGFYNYYSLSLFLQTIKEDWLLETLTRLDESTREKFQESIESAKKKLKIKTFNAWDYNIALEKWSSIPDNYFPKDSVFNVLHRFHRGIGFNVDSLPIREKIQDIPFGGLNIGVKIPGDSRFLLNPIKGKAFYNVTFHEYGHALQITHTKVDFPVLKGYEWIPGASCAAYSEGVAAIQAEFVNDAEWLSAYTPASQDEIDKYIATRTFSDIYSLRNRLKDFYFEYEMYKNPDQDLDSLERALFQKYLLVELDENVPSRYASSMLYVSYPCYYQNYILSDMIAAQVFEVVVSKFGEERLTNPDVSKWITSHLYTNGEVEEWQDRIINATGKSLETGAYLRKLKIMN